MKGVSMIRVTFRAHAYCLGAMDEPVGSCPFERKATLTVTAAKVRNEAQRHVQRTGHNVLVDVVDRTDYGPMPQAAEGGAA